jgi:hypothetical protein
MRTLAALALSVSLVNVAPAQATDSLRADSAFRASDWPTVARLYATMAQRSPRMGQAWIRLGIARQALGQLDSAVAPLERALALQFQVPTATLRLARVHARRGDVARALGYLEQVVPLRAIPPAIVDTLSDFATLKSDARFASIVARMVALRYPCRAGPEARQFDFWLGDWDVYPFQAPMGPGTPVLGRNRVELQLESCLVMENWTAAGPGGTGKSMNFWDTNRGKWRQVWVADGGGSLDYSGEFRDGAMRFEAWTAAPNGGRVMQKLTFFPIHADTVRQLFETSADSGRSWQPGFDGRYVRRK